MSTTLRVLFSFSTRIGTPGIGTTAWNQATGLARRGAEVHVATGSVARPMPNVRVAMESMSVGRMRIPYRLVGASRAAAWHDWRVARLLRRRPGFFDLVHAWPGAALQTFRAARETGVRSFLERPNAHTAFAFEVVARECEKLGIRVDKSNPHAFDADRLAEETAEFAAADALLCPSDFVAQTHAQRGTPRSRLLRHHYGYDPGQFWPDPVRDARSVPIFLFVGRLEPRKGVHLALDAWRMAKMGSSARFMLCGPIDPGYEAVLQPLIAQSGVEYLGPVKDPSHLMRQCDVLVLPSLEEGSALVTYEARGSGAVLMVSDRAGAIVTDRHDGRVHHAGDVEELARHFRECADDPARLASLRQNSLRTVDALTWDAAAVALLRAYDTGLARVHDD